MSSTSAGHFGSYQPCLNNGGSVESHMGPFSAQLSGQDSFAWTQDNHDGVGYPNNGSGALDDSHVPSVSMENLSFPTSGVSATPVVDTSNMVVNDMQYTMSVYQQETKMLHTS